MSRRAIVVRAGFLATASLLGGLVALGGVALTGDLGGATTVVRTSPAPTPAAQVAGSSPLTVAEIYARAAPGVVQITSRSGVQDDTSNAFPFDTPQLQPEQALGSGFVLDKAGHIVTNYHVIEGATEIEVSFSNNDSMSAKVVGSDPSSDIAVLKVDASTRALTPLELGDSDSVQVGDGVVAIGNPLGLERTATAGIVSALHRGLRAPDGAAIDEVIQTDAPINQGNSGGPLLNARGAVIGVNSQISTAGGGTGNIGIAFAVPINTVKDVTAQLIETGRVERAFIGIGAHEVTPELARVFRLPTRRGLMVESVVQGSGADKAGIEDGSTQVVVAGESYTLGGDIIVKVDGEQVSTLEDLRRVLTEQEPGDEIELELYRGDEKRTVEVKLGRQPATPQR